MESNDATVHTPPSALDHEGDVIYTSVFNVTTNQAHSLIVKDDEVTYSNMNSQTFKNDEVTYGNVHPPGVRDNELTYSTVVHE